MISNLVQKGSNIYICEKCDYKTIRKSQYERHLLTNKHNDNKKINSDNIKIRTYECKCGNVYKHLPNLSRHKKTCNYQESEVNNKVNTNETNEKVDYKEMFMQMLNQNKELQDLLISQQEEFMKQQKELLISQKDLFIKQQEETNKKFENLVLHIKPSNTINSNNKTINNNNFNVMMFLNDKCKDAMTIQEFAEKLVITIEDLEKKKFDCLSNTILKNLKSLAITERPVHCGNIKKKEWYLHDRDNGWEMDNGEKLIKNTEYGINKKYKDEFKRHYPDYSTVESIQDKYMRLINTTLTDLPENEKSRLLNMLSKDLILDSESI
jgi:hypothetical protein